MPDSIVIFSTDWLNQRLEGGHEHSSNIAASRQTQLTCRRRKPEKAATAPNYSQTTSSPVRNGEAFRMEKGQEAHLGQPVSGFELALVLPSPTPTASHTDYFCSPNSCPMCAENYLYSLGLPLSLVLFSIQSGDLC